MARTWHSACTSRSSACSLFATSYFRKRRQETLDSNIITCDMETLFLLHNKIWSYLYYRVGRIHLDAALT